MEKNFLLFVSASFLLLASCKKETPQKVCGLNETSIIGSYKKSALTYQADANSPKVDYLALQNPCDRDNLFVVNANKTIFNVDAGLVCSPSSGSTNNWTLLNDSLKIDSETYFVSDFSCTEMKLKLSAGGASTAFYTLTLVRE